MSSSSSSSSKPSYRLHLTAFGPFPGTDVNPSELICRSIQHESLASVCLLATNPTSVDAYIHTMARDANALWNQHRQSWRDRHGIVVIYAKPFPSNPSTCDPSQVINIFIHLGVAPRTFISIELTAVDDLHLPVPLASSNLKIPGTTKMAKTCFKKWKRRSLKHVHIDLINPTCEFTEATEAVSKETEAKESNVVSDIGEKNIASSIKEPTGDSYYHHSDSDNRVTLHTRWLLLPSTAAAATNNHSNARRVTCDETKQFFSQFLSENRIKLSTHCGTYLCNYIFYRSLQVLSELSVKPEEISQHKLPKKATWRDPTLVKWMRQKHQRPKKHQNCSLFLHVCPESVFPLKEQFKVVDDFIEKLLSV